MTISLDQSTVLVTGANRGLGKAFAEALVEAGATVYAGARNPDSVTTPGVTAVRLDVTDPASVAAARCTPATRSTASVRSSRPT